MQNGTPFDRTSNEDEKDATRDRLLDGAKSPRGDTQDGRRLSSFEPKDITVASDLGNPALRDLIKTVVVERGGTVPMPLKEKKYD